METLKDRITHHETELAKAQAKVKDVQKTIRILKKEQAAIDKPKRRKVASTIVVKKATPAKKKKGK